MYYNVILCKQSAETRQLWLDLTTIVGDEILGNDLNIIDDLEIRWSLVTNGLNADAIKETLNGTDDSSLNTMLLNMPTNKCSNLKDFGDYLMHATKYSDILFKFNLVNTTRKIYIYFSSFSVRAYLIQ